MAEDGQDVSTMSHGVRLGLLSPEKTLMITGIFDIAYRELMGGIEIVEMMHRFGFRNMGVIHKRDVHKVMPQPEFIQIDSMKRIDPYAPVMAEAFGIYRGNFKFFNYADSDPKEIILPPDNVAECLNQILKLQYPQQTEFKRKLILPDKQPVIQAKILSLAA